MDGSGADTRAGSRISVAAVTVYAIAQLKFTDRAAYDRYQARFMGVFARHTGTLLADLPQPVPFAQLGRVVAGPGDVVFVDQAPPDIAGHDHFAS